MSFDKLPLDILFKIISSLRSRNIAKLALSCRKINKICNKNDIWKMKINDHHKLKKYDRRINSIYLSGYKNDYNYWYFDETKKSEKIDLSKHKTTAYRVTPLGSNPSVMTKRPLTPKHNSFKIKIQSLGDWISIGFAELGITLEQDHVVGFQENVYNFGFYYVYNTREKYNNIIHNGIEIKKNVVDKLESGDTIQLRLDFKLNKILLTINDSLIILEESPFNKKTIYPTISLAFNSIVSIK